MLCYRLNGQNKPDQNNLNKNIMKRNAKHVIIQYNSIKEFTVIAKDVDIHYCREICGYLNAVHSGFKYTYFEMNYFKANKANLIELL